MVLVTIVTVVGAMNAAVDDLVSVMMSALRREPMQTMTQDCDAAVGGNQQYRHELSGSGVVMELANAVRGRAKNVYSRPALAHAASELLGQEYGECGYYARAFGSARFLTNGTPAADGNAK